MSASSFPGSRMNQAGLTAVLALAVALSAPAAASSLTVQVADRAGAPLADAVVYAEPAMRKPTGAAARSTTIEQIGRQFVPQVSVVQTGTAVAFPNNDTVRHHVYSFSATKPFELKLYSGTPGSPILFDKPGTVILGCNIHDQMVAYIQVVNTPYFGKSDSTGKVQIADLPPGKYKLKAWHHQLASNAAPVESDITVAKNDTSAELVLATQPAAGGGR